MFAGWSRELTFFLGGWPFGYIFLYKTIKMDPMARSGTTGDIVAGITIVLASILIVVAWMMKVRRDREKRRRIARTKEIMKLQKGVVWVKRE